MVFNGVNVGIEGFICLMCCFVEIELLGNG